MSSQSTNAQTGRASTNAELERALSVPAANVLIIGARETDVADVQARVAEPVTVMADAPAYHLAGTCLIADAVRLTRDHQDALLRRLEQGPALRLITLSAVPLYPFVESG